uniref:Pentatricopeptide repeat-containing protein At3g53700, chloroplastic-like n=1 Tax=Nicotiana sylvestris TaxID=4096 RepID=A0A1U7Y764_NICSY|nr:PREDICTED: pentatricopeptide repeat-containing protein At3g53700, chloroplastic-like [Nicotiana sylvestris]
MGGSESDGILVKPDLVLYNTLIGGLSKMVSAKQARLRRSYELFDQMKKGGLVPSVISLNTLLGGMCKHEKPDRYTYNTLISYFSQKEQFAIAHRVMKRMIDDGYFPNVVTYGALMHIV